MTPVILHIGITKTGTSTLQAFLHAETDRLGRAGLGYATSGRGRRNPRAHHNLYWEIRERDDGIGTYDEDLGGWQQTLDEIDRSDHAVGILSSETFASCTAREVTACADLLAGREVFVVVYLRRPESWLASAWNQRARFGRASLDFHEWLHAEGWELVAWERVLSPWIHHFGDAKVDVRSFETAVANGGIVQDFVTAHLDGVTLAGWEPGPPRNTQARHRHLVAVAHVVARCRAALGDDFQLQPTSAIRISQFFRDRAHDEPVSVVDHATADLISRTCRVSTDTLATLSSTFRSWAPFRTPTRGDFAGAEPISLDDIRLFDGEERAFVERMAREIVRASRPLVETAS